MARGRHRKWAAKIGLTWLVITLACNGSLPRKTSPTEVILPEPTYTERIQTEVPPVVVETLPVTGSVLGWRQAVTIYFNQPMDAFSVESALSLSPEFEYSVDWVNPATVTLTPLSDLPASSAITLTVGSTAKAENTFSFVTKYEIKFKTADALSVSNQIPLPGAVDVNPSAAVMVSFNQPVAPFGNSAEFDQAAFQLEPPSDGWGEWVNTSTYIFHPEPALAGGQEYLVVINETLASQAGASFGGQPPVRYGFSTLPPGITDVSPTSVDRILIDQEFTITFNQVMQPPSVAENLRLLDAAGAVVPSELTWDTGKITFSLKPSSRLARDADYQLVVGARSEALGGALLREDVRMDYRTVGELTVTKTNPADGGALNNRFNSIYMMEFNTPLADQDLYSLIKITPQLEGLRLTHAGDKRVLLDGEFKAGTTYRVAISEQIRDRWDGTLGAAKEFTFRVLDDMPFLTIPGLVGSMAFLYQPVDERQLPVTATNITSVTVQQAKVALDDLPEILSLYWDTGVLSSMEPAQWQQQVDLERNVSQTALVNANEDGSPLVPGLYYYEITSPQITEDGAFLSRPFLLVASQLQVYMKRCPLEVFVWLVRNDDLQPQRDQSVRFLREDGSQTGACTTGMDGICSVEIDADGTEGYDGYLYAVSGEPGSTDFSMGVSDWNQGVNGWELGVLTNPYPEEAKVYLYSDRPIYQPGQTVHYKAIVKDMRDGRFLPAPGSSFTVNLVGTYSELTGSVPTLGTDTITLNEWDTGNGDFQLPENAPPGTYSLQVDGFPSDALQFQVAEYRKPEIDLKVDFSAPDWLADQVISASVKANYFFGAPADRLKVQYTLYARSQVQDLPEDYQAGVAVPFWFDPPDWQFYSPELGEFVLSGQGETDADGSLTVLMQPEEVEKVITLPNRTHLTLEVTITDAGGQPVSTRAKAWLHPAEFAIGVKTEQWVGRATESMGFLLQTIDLQEKPSGSHALTAKFNRVDWRMRFDPEEGAVYEATRTLVSSADLETDTLGRARLVFTPPISGTYELSVSGGGAETVRMVWVAGAGQTLWPQPPNNELPITSDAESYRVGETASIFIPNPFGGRATVLVTMERERVTAHQVLDIDKSNLVIELPLQPLDAPNVFVAVTIIGRDEEGKLDFRQGYLELMVDPEAHILNVSVESEEGVMAPGEDGLFKITVTDVAGNPVVGDLSIALVDKAVLALADPMEPGIIEAFYGERPLRIKNGFSLAGYTGRFLDQQLGKGGGGGGEFAPAPQLRSRFEDTAFWRGSFQTDASGQAHIRVSLPDNLTTWEADVRGISADARVGMGTAEVVATKDLLVRPVAPAFLLAGDHVEIAAIVHNNSGNDLVVDVALQQSGLKLDAASPSEQRVTLPAGGRQRVAWWASVSDAETVELIFSAQAGELSDQTTPVGGAIPVLRYTRQDTFGTAGVLEMPGERVEIISLPRTFEPAGGNLRLELTPSLAAQVFASMDLNDPPKYDHAEALISDLVPVLAWLPVASQLGLDTWTDFSKLGERVQHNIDRLVKIQNADGGWGWWGGLSNNFISAYTILGLGEAAERGYAVPPDTLARAIAYLSNELFIPELISSGEGLDRQMFYRYALYRAGEEWVIYDDVFYTYRSELQPWSQALLAIMMHSANPEDARILTLISDLEGAAQATSTGVYWQDKSMEARQNWSSTNTNTAVVLLALAQINPRSNLVAPAARYLAEQHAGEGRWSSSYERAWVLMALSETTRVTGELLADYSYTAHLGDRLLADGDLSGTTTLEATRVDVPLDQLDSGAGTPLRIARTAGDGRLFYRAFLSLISPLIDEQAVERGFTLDRRYYLLGDACGAADCAPVSEVQLSDAAQFILARLEIVVPQDRYYVVVEDFFPAGSEAVNLNLKTSQIGSGGFPVPDYDENDPYGNGWAWWYFSPPEVYSSSIRWTAEYLPAGTYVLEYRLNPLYAGEFQVMPAHANEYFFPDVEGSSAGTVFKIQSPD